MNFVEALDVRMEEIGSACTRCGKYFQACPMTEPTGFKDEEPTKVLSGIVDILRGDAGSVEAEAWASACLSNGFCIEACDYRVNPRMIVRLAHLAMTRWRDGEAVKSNAMRSFRAMAKAVRIISRLQPETDALNELQPPPGQERSESGPDIANYTGCNVRKTPHILILCLDVFRAMGMTLGLLRGLPISPGDADTSGRAGLSTLRQIEPIGAREKVSWCPNCQTKFDDVIIPSHCLPWQRTGTSEQRQIFGV